jgi:hypothetical protein
VVAWKERVFRSQNETTMDWENAPVVLRGLTLFVRPGRVGVGQNTSLVEPLSEFLLAVELRVAVEKIELEG